MTLSPSLPLACSPPQGYFYYYLDIGRAVLACTDPDIVNHSPDSYFSMDFDTKSTGMDGINLLMWRWLVSSAEASRERSHTPSLPLSCALPSTSPALLYHPHPFNPLTVALLYSAPLGCTTLLRTPSPTRSYSRSAPPGKLRNPSFANIKTCGASTTVTLTAAPRGWE